MKSSTSNTLLILSLTLTCLSISSLNTALLHILSMRLYSYQCLSLYLSVQVFRHKITLRRNQLVSLPLNHFQIYPLLCFPHDLVTRARDLHFFCTTSFNPGFSFLFLCGETVTAVFDYFCRYLRAFLPSLTIRLNFFLSSEKKIVA